MFGQLELIIEEKRETELPLANSTVRFGSREGKIETDLSTRDSPAETEEEDGQDSIQTEQLPAAQKSFKFLLRHTSLVINGNRGPGDRGVFSEGCDLLAF